MKSEFISTIKKKAKDGTLRTVWKDWKWIWSFSRRRKWAVLGYTLCGIFSSCLGLLAGVVSKYMIDAIVAMELGPLLWYILAMVGSVVLGVTFQSLTSRFSARLHIDMLTDVQQQVFDQLMDSDWESISAYPTGELLSRFAGDINTVASCAVSWLPGLVIQLFTVVSTLAVILYYDPVMALIGCASTPLLFLLSRRFLHKQRSYNLKMRQVSGEMSAFQAETFRNVDTLKSFGVEKNMSDMLRLRQRDYRETVLDHNRFSIRTNVLLTAMGTAVQYGALAYCLWRLWRGDILFGTMTLFLQQRSNLSDAFSALVSLVPTALSGSVAAERVRELTQLPKEPDHTPVAVPQGACSLVAEGVSVGYGQKGVLSQVDITAPAGKIIALVGPSGEGKTTLLRLLLGLIRPDSGSVHLIDGEGNRISVGAGTRNCFTYVPQGNTVIAGTVADNLRLARQDATEEEMIAALQDACAWEFVEPMEQGIHSQLGEGGKGVSEGQAQRIAIARALIRNAPVMLLDEVTSALDQATEERVLENLTHRGVTTILTTHRPSVLSQCSRVYRVQGGRVEQI